MMTDASKDEKKTKTDANYWFSLACKDVMNTVRTAVSVVLQMQDGTTQESLFTTSKFATKKDNEPIEGESPTL